MTDLKPIYRGDDFGLEIIVRDKATQTAIDITDWRFDSTMKLSSEQPDLPELDKQGNRQVLTTSTKATDHNAKEGMVMLLFESNDTAQLIATNYQIDVQAIVSTAVQTLYVGNIKVLSDVTHRGSDS